MQWHSEFCLRFARFQFCHCSEALPEILRHRNANLWASTQDGCGCNGTANSVCALLDFSFATARKHYQKFFATVAPYEIIRTDALGNTFCNFSQNDITGQMSMSVVYILEVVEVQHENRR